MNFDGFIDTLATRGFRTEGKSYAFLEHNHWLIAFLRFGGKFQQPGRISFVLCARPLEFFGLEKTSLTNPQEPHEYPFILTRCDFGNRLEYKSKLLHYEHDEMGILDDWSFVLNFLLTDFPDILDALDVDGLEEQLQLLDDPGYLEKIWQGAKYA